MFNFFVLDVINLEIRGLPFNANYKKMKQIDRRIVIVAALIFIVGLAFGLMKFLSAQKPEPPRRPAVVAKRMVKAEEIKYTTIKSPVSAPGRVASISQVDIIAEASGKILVNNIPLKKEQNSQKEMYYLLFIPMRPYSL